MLLAAPARERRGRRRAARRLHRHRAAGPARRPSSRSASTATSCSLRAPAATRARVRVETILSGAQAAQLRRDGHRARAEARSAARPPPSARPPPRPRASRSSGTYSGAGGLKEEFEQVAAANPAITKLVTIGKTRQRARTSSRSRSAANARDDARRQQARGALPRRAARARVDHAGDDPPAHAPLRRRLRHRRRRSAGSSTTNELWFVPVANPDGYDWTFEPGQRLWRKNLRDNNGDGQITRRRRRRPQPQLPDEVGLRQRGLVARPGQRDLPRRRRRRPSPRRRRSTRSAARVGFEFLVNYHSAAELLLYGTGWQVATPTPDDVLYEAMAGDDAAPGGPRLRPRHLRRALHDQRRHRHAHDRALRHARLHARDVDLRGRVRRAIPTTSGSPRTAAACFEFPDDEALVQAEFEKNIPFALSVARVGRATRTTRSRSSAATAEDFRVDTLRRLLRRPADGRGRGQARAQAACACTTASTAGATRDGRRVGVARRRALRRRERRLLRRAARHGARRPAGRRGRGLVRRAASGRRSARRAASASPTPSRSDTRRRRARDRQRGLHGRQPDLPGRHDRAEVRRRSTSRRSRRPATTPTSGTSTRRACRTTSACSATTTRSSGTSATTASPRTPRTSSSTTPFGAAARHRRGRAPAVPDDGRARLPQRGRQARSTPARRAQYQGLPGISDVVGGLYYGSTATRPRRVRHHRDDRFFDDCLLLADDFRQYYLGAFTRVDVAGPTGVAGVADADRRATTARFGGPVVEGDNPLDEAGVFQPTSDVLPPDEFPQFAQPGGGEYRRHAAVRAGRGHALRGRRARGRLVHAPDEDGRPRRAATTARSCSSSCRSTPSTGYDHVIVEAHTRRRRTTGRRCPTSAARTTTDVAGGVRRPGFLLDDAPVPDALPRRPASRARPRARRRRGTRSPARPTAGSRSPSTCRPSRASRSRSSIAYVTDPSHGRRRRVRRRHAASSSTASIDARTASRARRAPGPSPAAPAGSPRTRRDWVIGPRLRPLRRHVDARHAAARLRPRAARDGPGPHDARAPGAPRPDRIARRARRSGRAGPPGTDKCPIADTQIGDSDRRSEAYEIIRLRAATSLAMATTVAIICLAAPAASFAGGPLAGWWPMNEGQGQTVYDWSGNGNNGMLGSTPGVDAHDPGLDGRPLRRRPRARSSTATTFVTIPRSRRARAQAPHRLDVGPRATRRPARSSTSWPRAATLRRGLVRPVHRRQRRHRVLHLRRRRTSTSPPRPSPSVWNNTWHNAAGTFDGSKVRLYVDGKQVGSGTPVPAGTRHRATRSPTAAAAFGDYPNNDCGLTLNGDIDTVRIWNQALPIDLYWAIARSLFNRHRGVPRRPAPLAGRRDARERRGRDSNPRTRLTPVTRFPVVPVQPLRHLSWTAGRVAAQICQRPSTQHGHALAVARDPGDGQLVRADHEVDVDLALVASARGPPRRARTGSPGRARCGSPRSRRAACRRRSSRARRSGPRGRRARPRRGARRRRRCA